MMKCIVLCCEAIWMNFFFTGALQLERLEKAIWVLLGVVNVM